MSEMDAGITEALDGQFREMTDLDGIVERQHMANAGMVDPPECFVQAVGQCKWYLPDRGEWVTLREIVRRKWCAFRKEHNLTPTHVLFPQEFNIIASSYGVDGSSLSFLGMKVLDGLPWFECFWLPGDTGDGI